MRISDWSSDVCSSDLEHEPPSAADLLPVATPAWLIDIAEDTAWLLRRGADTCTEENADLENLRCRHIALFREAGLLCGGGSVRQQRLRKAIVEKYGEPFLCAVGCQLSTTGAEDRKSTRLNSSH